MASNKAAAAIFIAAFAMIFAVEVAVAQDMRKLLHHDDHHHHHHHHHHHIILHHHIKPPCTKSILHFKLNGFDFKMEKGHEACYIACYKNVFVAESSPLTAEDMCHEKCSSATADHPISSTFS